MTISFLPPLFIGDVLLLVVSRKS